MRPRRVATGTEIRALSKRWYDTHHALTREEQREALAHTLARELTAGATRDNVGGLKERGLVRSAPESRTLLREYGLDWARPTGAWTMSNCALHSTVECLRLSCIHARGVAASGCLVVPVTGMATVRAGSRAPTATPITP